MTPAVAGLVPVDPLFCGLVFVGPEGCVLAAQAPSVGTIVGILFYGAVAYAAIRLAVRWAEAALTTRPAVPPGRTSGPARPPEAPPPPPGSDRAGR
jgi:hypothetical protein